MEEPLKQPGEGVTSEKPQASEKNSPEAVKSASSKTAANPGGSVSARKRVTEPRNGSGLGLGTGSSAGAAKRSGSSSSSATSVSAPRRNSTGGLPQKPSISDGRRKTGADSAVGGSKSTTEPARRSLPELRRSSVASPRSGVAAKPAPASPVRPGLRTSVSKVEVTKKPLSKPALSVSSSRSVRSSSSVDSTASSGGGSARRTVSKLSSPSAARSPSVSGGLRAGSLSSSASSLDRSSGLSGRRKVGTPDSRDSKFVVLPQVEIKANDDLVSFVFVGTFLIYEVLNVFSNLMLWL